MAILYEVIICAALDDGHYLTQICGWQYDDVYLSQHFAITKKNYSDHMEFSFSLFKQIKYFCAIGGGFKEQHTMNSCHTNTIKHIKYSWYLLLVDSIDI